MLELKDITKVYKVAGEEVQALKGISLNFRKNEFVSILGPSGCGKTTLLNIIGGLDKYTDGDLVIQGISTKEYTDRDWDTYRNHSIGFIFQSYHLIPHQTILQNVELALMISGVSKRERRRRALEALEKVGLKDKINNRPNQLSGGQAQRVAIARALINDPEIVLADEPTGALDSKTSVQIMDLLKEIAKDRLVIMVTHNPELAERYSTRIIKLLDGVVMGDSRPYDGKDEEEDLSKLTKKERKKRNMAKGSKRKTAMSPFMAMSLSLKNLLSKHKRTTMVSVAGSIGIIGVSMVLAISSGVQNYINTLENDMLSGYPVSITSSTVDFTSLLNISEDSADDAKKQVLSDLKANKKINVNSLLSTLGSFSAEFQTTNTITSEYLKYIEEMPAAYTQVVQYGYDYNLTNNLYTDFTVTNAENLKGEKSEKYEQIDEADNVKNMSVAAIRSMYASVLTNVEGYEQWGSMISTVATFKEVPDNYDYVMSQYDIVAIDRDGNVVTDGYTDEEVKELFESKNSLIMVLSHGKVDDLTLAQYGYLNEDEFIEYAQFGAETDEDTKGSYHLVGDDGLDFSMFIGGKTFTYYPNDTVYQKTEVASPANYSKEAFIATLPQGYEVSPEMDAMLDTLFVAIDNYKSYPDASQYIKFYLENNKDKFNITDEIINAIVGYMQIEEAKASEQTVTGFKAYANSDEFTVADKSKDAVELGVKLILQKKEDISYGCLSSGFYYTKALTDYILDNSAESEIVKYLNENPDSLTSVGYTYSYYYSDENGNYVKRDDGSGSISKKTALLSTIITSVSGYDSDGITAGLFGGNKLPTSIYFYAVDFDSKNAITDYLDAWNDKNDAEHQITYTDSVGLIINMVNTMIEMITIALVAFTALSLVVSTVMIGIITYVSVVERVKEIGILRAVGARKKDIKRLFNAETFIIGLVAGLFGIAITYLLSLIVNVIVLALAGVWGIAALPWWEALVMIALSIVLTLISGLIPASAAAKKDPVVALRTE